MAWKPFSTAVEKSILDAIRDAENQCSGEIRIHVDRFCKGDPYFKATNIFHHLEMAQTQLRNGVLIYVAVKDHKFAILGDEGIDQKVEEGFWESTKAKMIEEFSKGDIPGGIVRGIQEAGIQLKKYFPADDSLGNELSDELSYGS
jgi:uncharacterized membrane protein